MMCVGFWFMVCVGFAWFCNVFSIGFDGKKVGFGRLNLYCFPGGVVYLAAVVVSLIFSRTLDLLCFRKVPPYKPSA